ncbi:MAG: hypothetical protein ABWY00_18400 [Dongiaceae bacterium]
MTALASSPLRHPDLIAIEKLERATFLEIFDSVPPHYQAKREAKFSDRGSTALFAMRGLPGFEFNKVLGLGVEEPASEDQLDAAIDWLRTYCHPQASLQIAAGAGPSALPRWIAERGLKPHGDGWAIFRRGTAELPDETAATTLTVREVYKPDADLFGEIVQTAFGLPADFATMPSAIVGRAAIRAYIAYNDKRPVAAAVLCIKDGWGWLGFGGTLTGFRRRGAQTALLRRRLADGIAMGLRGFVVETGNPAPGTERSHSSYGNIRRAGFELAYLRTNYRLPAP